MFSLCTKLEFDIWFRFFISTNLVIRIKQKRVQMLREFRQKQMYKENNKNLDENKTCSDSKSEQLIKILTKTKPVPTVSRNS